MKNHPNYFSQTRTHYWTFAGVPNRAKVELGLCALMLSPGQEKPWPQTQEHASKSAYQVRGTGIKGRKRNHMATNPFHLCPALLSLLDLFLTFSAFGLYRLPWKDPTWDHFQIQASQGKEMEESECHTVCKAAWREGFLASSWARQKPWFSF